MTHIVKARFSTAFIAVLIAFSMTSCLPGKEQEKKVIAQAKDATQTVQAEKVAADMGAAAQKLLATATEDAPEITDTKELKTVSCNGKVIAFIPKTSAMADNGALPVALGQRLTTELQRSFKESNVVDASKAGCSVSTDIAQNSPVLILNDETKAMLEVSENKSEFVEISMTPCPNGQPGVVVTRVYRADANGNKKPNDVQHKCGKAVDRSNLPTFSVGTGSMPDYQARLSSGGNISAARNFKCVAKQGDNKCIQDIKAVARGSRLICNNTGDTTELVANPVFVGGAESKFKPQNDPMDCGRGWKGTLVARVQTQNCVLQRNDTSTETPAKVFDIAFVGAKCEKPQVVSNNACPAGTAFAGAGSVMTQEDMDMVNFLALEPKKSGKTNNSAIAYKTTKDGQTVTNMSSDTNKMVQQAQNVTMPGGGVQSHNFFAAISDLSAVGSDQFDKKYVSELRKLNKIKRKDGTEVICYAKAQDCAINSTPQQMEIIVDRSIRMKAPLTTKIYQSYTACESRFKDLFSEDRQADACAASDEWNRIAKSTGILKAVINGWGNGGDPIYKTNTYLDILIDGKVISKAPVSPLSLSAQDRQALSDAQDTMYAALKYPAFKPKLRYGLGIGQACGQSTSTYMKGTFIPGGTYDSYTDFGKLFFNAQEDMYGHCTQDVITQNEIGQVKNDVRNIFVKYESSCPGRCVTRVVGDKNYKPKAPTETAIQAADRLLKETLIRNVPLATKANYSEILLNDVDKNPLDPFTPKGWEDAAPFKSTSLIAGATQANASYFNKAYRGNEVMASLGKEKSATIPVVVEKAIVAGDRSNLFQAIDNAINRLRVSVLDADPNAAASIVIEAQDYDNGCSNEGQQAMGSWGEIQDVLEGKSPPHSNNFYSGGTWTGAKVRLTNGVEEADKAVHKATPCKKAKIKRLDETFEGNFMYESEYFSRNFCTPERVPVGYLCEYRGGNVTGETSMYRIAYTPELMRAYYDGDMEGSRVDGYRARYNFCELRSNKFYTTTGADLLDDVEISQVKAELVRIIPFYEWDTHLYRADENGKPKPDGTWYLRSPKKNGSGLITDDTHTWIKKDGKEQKPQGDFYVDLRKWYEKYGIPYIRPQDSSGIIVPNEGYRNADKAKGDILYHHGYRNASGRAKDGFSGTQKISSLPYDNDSSMVGFIGRHYPNVKVYVIDMSGQGVYKMCNTRFSHNEKEPHGFFNKKQILFTYDGTKPEQVQQAMRDIAGGGQTTPSVEAGEKICRDKFGNGVTISTDDPPRSFTPSGNTSASYESLVLSKGPPTVTYDPGTYRFLPSINFLGMPTHPTKDCPHNFPWVSATLQNCNK